MAKQKELSPWQVLEEGVYHAFREWHVWLLLRERELQGHLKSTQGQSSPEKSAEKSQTRQG
jgi:hypothetical protein